MRIPYTSGSVAVLPLDVEHFTEAIQRRNCSFGLSVARLQAQAS
jgi:hypothetical protein